MCRNFWVFRKPKEVSVESRPATQRRSAAAVETAFTGAVYAAAAAAATVAAAATY